MTDSKQIDARAAAKMRACEQIGEQTYICCIDHGCASKDDELSECERSVWEAIGNAFDAGVTYATTEQKWICTDWQLPENRQEVLAQFRDSGRLIQRSYENFTDQNAEWFKKTFIAWQPLPKAYAPEGDKTVTTTHDGVQVLPIKPFWLYAVVPAHLRHREAAMPFYTKKAALAFIEECKADTAPVFDMKMLLFRKVWFRRIEEVRL